MRNLYGYKVKYFNDVNNEIITERGILMEHCFTDAMNSLIEMYGEQELEDVNIYFIEECVTVVTEETLRDIYTQWEEEDEYHVKLENNHE